MSSRFANTAILVVLTFFILAVGCAKKQKDVNVQVFIVTEGRENIKLGLVTVIAIPYEQTREALKPIAAARDADFEKLLVDTANEKKEIANRLEEVQRHLMAVKTRARAAIQEAKRASDTFNKVVKSAASDASLLLTTAPFSELGTLSYSLRYSELDSSGSTSIRTTDSFGVEMFGTTDRAVTIVNHDVWNRLPDQRDAVLEAAYALETSVEQSKSISDDVRRLNALNSALPGDYWRDLAEVRRQVTDPDRFFQALPSSTIFAKTDAEGRCRLALPPNQHWVIVATASRQVNLSQERYRWIVTLPQSETNEIGLTLSNDNLLKPGAKPLNL